MIKDAHLHPTEKTLAKFRDKPLSWKGANCIKLARKQAINMGHQVPPVPLFASERGAIKALRKQGVRSTAELLDKWFERHPAPAFAELGDLVVLPGDRDGERDDVLAAIGIADGRGNVFAWHGSDLSKMSVIKLAETEIIAAWKL